jgi:molecular chaperone GrpE
MNEQSQSDSRPKETPPPAEPANGTSADENSAAYAETADSPNKSAVTSNDGEVERLAQELADTREKYLRTVAEMDNMRKRLERERSDFLKFSNESLLKDFIPVLDSLDKALPGDGKEDKASAGYIEGVTMVRKQLLATLNKYGLEPVESVDKPFDPNVHQAIQRIESDVSVETVAAEFAKGYTLHGRLLRAAMVSVKVPS